MTYDSNELMDKSSINEGTHFVDQELRIIDIIAPGQATKLDDLPNVSDETLTLYFDYLVANVSQKCVLTGRESMGYFSWEERFEWGEENAVEYDKLQKERGSYEDVYQLLKFISIASRDGIIVNVLRTSDKKKFNIPLGDLEVVEEKHDAWRLIEDYGMWICNYND